MTSDRRISSDDGMHGSSDAAAPDSGQCIVTGANLNRVFAITGAAVTGATTIRGFEILAGNATTSGSDPNNGYGGGICIADGADPVIERCWINNNMAGAQYNGWGGGIACDGTGTSPAIRNCRVTGNVATNVWYGYGGGIYCGMGTTCTIQGNWTEGNIAATHRVGSGGGICCYLSQSVIHDNTIVANLAASTGGSGGEGGGAWLYRSSCEF